MKSPLLRTSIVLAALMFAASMLAYALKPARKLVDIQPREKLEALLPQHFGDWHSQPATNVVLADPQMRASLARIYTETLTRTYVDSGGRQIMLSIAYGENQRDTMQMHYPEVCYPAQGFQMKSLRAGQIGTPFGSIRAKQLEMVLGDRHEAVTYWTMIGEYATLGGADKKLNEMRYGLHGVIPDGLLFRVSSIGHDLESAYRDHEEFIGALIETMKPEARKRLAGI